MRAAVFVGFDEPDDVEVREIDRRRPGRGEAVVDVDAASLNHRDLWKLKGASAPDTDGPFVGGSDLAGTVVETGEGVSNVGEGDRVVLSPNLTCGECRFCREGPENICESYGIYDGAFAEEAVVDASRLVGLPEEVSFEAAAALPIAYMTAYRMLRRGDLIAGDVVFVPGATGGVGTAAVQLANAMGAETIGTSQSAEKLLAVEETGLDHAVASDDPATIRDRVQSIGPVDVTINHLAGEYTALGLEVLRRNGTMVLCGRTAGQFPEFDVRDLYFGHKRILGSTMGTQHDLERVVRQVAEGNVEPLIADEFALEDASAMFRAMADREMVGKLLLRP